MRSENLIFLHETEIAVNVVYMISKTNRRFGKLALIRIMSVLTLLCFSDWSLSETALNKVKPDGRESVFANEVADVLDNKRLFFDAPYSDEKSDDYNGVHLRIVPGQKLSAAMDGVVPMDTGTADNVKVYSEHVLKRSDAAMNPVVEKVPEIRYEALISSAENIHIIINSLPCQALEADLLPSLTSGTTQVHCNDLVESDIRIDLLADKQRLGITRQTQLLGILSPGQQL